MGAVRRGRAGLCVSYASPWSGKPLVLSQLFATGMAAREAAGDETLRALFGEEAGRIERKARSTRKEAE